MYIVLHYFKFYFTKKKKKKNFISYDMCSFGINLFYFLLKVN